MFVNNDASVILVIDSDPLTLMGTAAVLNMEGHEVHCARDEAAALRAAEMLPLDLILAEVELDGHDSAGLRLCEQIRDEMGHRDVPMIFVSNQDRPELVGQAHNAGGAYYLRKPFDPDVLLEIVGKALWMPHVVQSKLDQTKADSEAHPQPKPYGLGQSRNRQNH